MYIVISENLHAVKKALGYYVNLCDANACFQKYLEAGVFPLVFIIEVEKPQEILDHAKP